MAAEPQGSPSRADGEPVRLLIHENAYKRLKAELDLLPVAPIVVSGDGPEGVVDFDAAWANQDVFFSPAARKVMGALLSAPSLRWVQSGAAGADHPAFQRIVDRGVAFTTSHGQAVGISEYVVASAWDALQRGPERRVAQAERRWARMPFREIGDTHWLVIGFGAIGEGVGRRAKALGAQVTGVRRRTDHNPSADRMIRLDQIGEMLPQADVVALCCPLTEETRGLAGAEFFAAMKPGSILVNVGRGALIDEAALLQALERGVPERAILDVFETEPLPQESPFWAHPKVTVTPHTSGATSGAQPRNDALFLENLQRFLAGEPLRNQIRG